MFFWKDIIQIKSNKSYREGDKIDPNRQMQTNSERGYFFQNFHHFFYHESKVYEILGIFTNIQKTIFTKTQEKWCTKVNEVPPTIGVIRNQHITKKL